MEHSTFVKKKNNVVQTLFVVVFACIVYASISIFTKEASKSAFLSIPYLCWIVGEILVFGVYAILWQKVLSILPLSSAYITKSLSIILVMMICNLFYNEAITVFKIVGIGLIVVGLAIFPWEK